MRRAGGERHILDDRIPTWFNGGMTAVRVPTLLLSLALSVPSVGCGGGAASSGTPASANAPVGGDADRSAAPTPTGPRSATGSIERDELIPVLDAGLGRFLGGVSTEPNLEDGRFTGWRIVHLYPEDPRFATVDLLPGDIVTEVNGQAIERPEQAFAVWNGLRVAEELHVAFVRDGEARELRFRIADEP